MKRVFNLQYPSGIQHRLGDRFFLRIGLDRRISVTHLAIGGSGNNALLCIIPQGNIRPVGVKQRINDQFRRAPFA